MNIYNINILHDTTNNFVTEHRSDEAVIPGITNKRKRISCTNTQEILSVRQHLDSAGVPLNRLII